MEDFQNDLDGGFSLRLWGKKKNKTPKRVFKKSSKKNEDMKKRKYEQLKENSDKLKKDTKDYFKDNGEINSEKIETLKEEIYGSRTSDNYKLGENESENESENEDKKKEREEKKKILKKIENLQLLKHLENIYKPTSNVKGANDANGVENDKKVKYENSLKYEKNILKKKNNEIKKSIKIINDGNKIFYEGKKAFKRSTRKKGLLKRLGLTRTNMSNIKLADTQCKKKKEYTKIYTSVKALGKSYNKTLEKAKKEQLLNNRDFRNFTTYFCSKRYIILSGAYLNLIRGHTNNNKKLTKYNKNHNTAEADYKISKIVSILNMYDEDVEIPERIYKFINYLLEIIKNPESDKMKLINFLLNKKNKEIKLINQKITQETQQTKFSEPMPQRGNVKSIIQTTQNSKSLHRSTSSNPNTSHSRRRTRRRSPPATKSQRSYHSTSSSSVPSLTNINIGSNNVFNNNSNNNKQTQTAFHISPSHTVEADIEADPVPAKSQPEVKILTDAEIKKQLKEEDSIYITNYGGKGGNKKKPEKIELYNKIFRLAKLVNKNEIELQKNNSLKAKQILLKNKKELGKAKANFIKTYVDPQETKSTQDFEINTRPDNQINTLKRIYNS
jgi:hypothetical protein